MKFSQISFIVLLFIAYVGNVILFSTFLENDHLVQTNPDLRPTIETVDDLEALQMAARK